MKSTQNIPREVVVWDFPTRIFHWTLLIAFSAAWLTSENDRFLYHHVFAGYTFFGLLLFRLMWGVIGTHYAQFRSFAHNWGSVTEYLKGLITGQASRYLGHNPAGSWAIFAMLLLGIIISISGLMVLGGTEGHGPLAGLVSFDLGDVAEELHESLAEIMLALTFIHLAGVIVESLYHKENLVWAMITGRKPADLESLSVRTYPLLGVAMLLIIFGSSVYYFHGYFTQTQDHPFLAFEEAPLPDNKTWRDACGECHLAFHPVLLPARSWERMMREQSDHFGEDLALEPDVVDEITRFLVANSSEQGLNEVAHRMTRAIPAGDSPQRITEVGYWRKKHEEIDARYWKTKPVETKANCGACHLDAKNGWFEDSNMKLPELQ